MSEYNDLVSFTVTQHVSKEDLDKVKVAYQDLNGLLYFIQKRVFENVYGYDPSSYELDDLQDKLDQLEEDGEFPACYYRIKEDIKKGRVDES